ncbi:MAG TPA: PEP-CTERM/exosortase system-associated acyltransferase [Candidatus Binatia bacterium]|nr:PEP-CTERM/exosortase system-associated acyltransferase [Candidatus Binatia bacterium]
MLENEYDFFLADTDAGKSIHYRLRYQVYCLREHYEDPAKHPQFLERDEYDTRSAHFIARNRCTGDWLGAMRLIVGAAHNLPVARFSQVTWDSLRQVHSKNFAEASRLCTLLPFNDSSANSSLHQRKFGPPQCGATKPLQTSWISLGLIRAARQYCLAHDITFCFFLISDPLARILRRLGMEMEPVGSPCQHRGWRSPYIHNVRTGYHAMSVRSPELYRSFCQSNAYHRYSELIDDNQSRMAAIG